MHQGQSVCRIDFRFQNDSSEKFVGLVCFKFSLLVARLNLIPAGKGGNKIRYSAGKRVILRLIVKNLITSAGLVSEKPFDAYLHDTH